MVITVNAMLNVTSVTYHMLSYWFTEGNYAEARNHFLYASRPEDYGSMLVEFACKKGYPSEADLFIAQAVLQWVLVFSEIINKA